MLQCPPKNPKFTLRHQGWQCVTVCQARLRSSHSWNWIQWPLNSPFPYTYKTYFLFVPWLNIFKFCVSLLWKKTILEVECTPCCQSQKASCKMAVITVFTLLILTSALTKQSWSAVLFNSTMFIWYENLTFPRFPFQLPVCITARTFKET